MSHTGAVYLDASAAAKLVTIEQESRALVDFLRDRPRQYSSSLLAVELRRVARRAAVADDAAVLEAESFLGRASLVEIDHRIIHTAGFLEPDRLRALDAIHLATALELGEEIEAMVVYDRQLAAGARRHGIAAVAPGADV
jgi:predicted nucleic acid-binding protein